MNQSDKALSLCAELYRVQQAIKKASASIREALEPCPNRGATEHLFIAYSSRNKPEDSYFPEELMLTDDEIFDALGEGGEFECKHCLKAHAMVLHRKYLKRLRAKIRYGITMVGKAVAEKELPQ